MKIIFKILALSVISLLTLSACKSPKEILPEGNVKPINTIADEFAPVQKPLPLEGCGICGREFLSPLQNNTDGILPAKQFLGDMIAGKILEKADAITFLDDKSGFFFIISSWIC